MTANLQGMWVDRSTPAVALLLPYLDTERAGWQYPFADIVAAGADTAGGSDWPVNPPEPVGAVHALVNRTSFSADGPSPDPLLPDQALTLTRALSTYTLGSAQVNQHVECGTLQIGAGPT